MKSTTAYRFVENQAYWPLPQLSLQQSSSYQSIKPSLSKYLQHLLCALTSVTEPRVWESQDAAGRRLWNAYDSASDKVIRNASETEVRAWLEARYQF